MPGLPEEVTLIAVGEAAPGKEARLRELTHEYCKHVHATEPSTITFECIEEEIDGRLRIGILERYKTQADLDAHLATAETAALFKAFQEEQLMTGAPLRLTGKSTAGHRGR